MGAAFSVTRTSSSVVEAGASCAQVMPGRTHARQAAAAVALLEKRGRWCIKQFGSREHEKRPTEGLRDLGYSDAPCEDALPHAACSRKARHSPVERQGMLWLDGGNRA
ncbi:hypothetical protein D3C78_1091970 [compost metagenome]